MKKRIARILLLLMFINLVLPQTLLAAPSYKDQDQISSWAVDRVVEASKKGILAGYQGYFNPKKDISRAEFTKLIVEALDLRGRGNPIEFRDVKSSDWYYDYVVRGTSNNIIKGSNGSFNPNGKISREEMAVIISRALDLGDFSPVDIKDFKEVSSWAIEDVNRVMDKGILVGADGSFNPKAKATREMAAVVIMRSYDYRKDQGEVEVPDLELGIKELEKSLDRTVAYILSEVRNPMVSTIGGEWAVLGLNRSKRDLDQGFNQVYLANLKKTLKEKEGQLHKTRYTEDSRVVLALNALGEDPENVGGYNLETRIKDVDQVKKQGINGPIFALMALNSRDPRRTPEKEAMIDYILERELESGGWALSSDIDKGDIDVTAMVIQSLSSFKEDPKIGAALDRGLNFLSKEQEADGGYLSWGSKNAENAAQVIIGLCSVGVDPHRDERFVKKDGSLVDFLLAYQLDSGAFRHEERGGANLMASEQALLALVSYERFLKDERPLYQMSTLEK